MLPLAGSHILLSMKVKTMAKTRLVDFRINRFQFMRDRVIGDAQVAIDEAKLMAIELIDEAGRVGLGFTEAHMIPLPSEPEIEAIFRAVVWPGLEGREPSTLAVQVEGFKGGHGRAHPLPFEIAVEQAIWDLFAQSLDLPLHKLLGQKRDAVPVYASGLDFHLSDHDYCEFFGRAADLGYRGFKIKVGHPDLERDVHRLDLLKRVVGPDAIVMIDANEAWTANQTLMALERFAQAGHAIYWIEDPVRRDDIDGLRMIRARGISRVNSGEYLDGSGRRKLLEARACDVMNVQGNVKEAMRTGWLANEANVEVALGNSLLEIGVNIAVALPNVSWLEYAFRNHEHLVETPYPIKDGMISPLAVPGHGIKLSDIARTRYRTPTPVAKRDLGPPPPMIDARVTRQ